MSTRRITVDVTDRIDDVDIVQWEQVATGSIAPVHYTRAYLRAYETSPLSPFLAARYVTVTEAGRTLAVLPCYLQKQGDPYGFLSAAGIEGADGPALLGHNWYCYDTRVPVRATGPGQRPRVLGAVLDALRDLAAADGARTAGLVSVPEGDPVLDVARDKGWQVAPIVTRYQLPLHSAAGDSFDSYDSYLATLGARTRRTIRQYLRRAADAGVSTAVEAPRPDFLRTVGDLTRRTAAKYGSADMYPESAFTDFVLALGDNARVVRVDRGEQTLAAAVVLLDEERLHMWAGGTSHATLDGFSPNYLLWATEIRMAIEWRKRWVEGGRSNAPMKTRHGMRPLRLFACVAPSGG
ncbi:GNAT family N-acetyltransferase [Streptomyces sp. NBC_00659]|uniref:GNAT family N-acetyltransferase n=1 Tax=Streptomyces sp. NBC_00659 TaxID=2903669 RepID=UPI002E2EEE21|nr:GNAT family N-acetyltransferase [Streptomyces sp. NBC_00659]